jgi:hypothetical protein
MEVARKVFKSPHFNIIHHNHLFIILSGTMSMQLGARRADGLFSSSTSARRLVSTVRTPAAHYSRSLVVINRRLIRGSATSSEADSSQKQEEEAKENDRIKQTLADLDALLGIEAEPEEVVEEKPEVGDGDRLTYLFFLNLNIFVAITTTA